MRTSSPQSSASSPSHPSRGGRFLSFSLDGTEYGLPIMKVREIIGMMQITPVPRTPHYVCGCMNLRGKIITVVDLRSIFEMEVPEDTPETRIIVVEMGDIDAGIVVDSVCEVLDIDDEHIEDRPELGEEVNTDFVLGMGKRDDQVTILIDISKVLSTGETLALGKLAAA